jgi:hypothetical protein
MLSTKEKMKKKNETSTITQDHKLTTWHEPRRSHHEN